jgi:prophage antirepressor-like protein
MTDLTTFNCGALSIRSMTAAGTPWFVAKDVCRALGYANTFHPLRMLTPEEKGI